MAFYTSRNDKYQWLVKRFAPAFAESKSILDIGCDQKVLKGIFPDKKYLGVDVVDAADVKLDLNAKPTLPWKAKSYDMVVCADVLEHLEYIHQIFDECCRVSNKHVLITLPNPAQGIFSYLFNMKSGKETLHFGKYLKFYGLPPEPPVDRHRWFYSYEEAVTFLKYRAQKNGFSVTVMESDLVHKNLSIGKRMIIGIVRLFNKNLVQSQVICLLTRSKATRE